MKSCRVWSGWLAACGLVLATLVLAGCKTTGGGDDFTPAAGLQGTATGPGETRGLDNDPAFRVGDMLTVVFSELPTNPSTQNFDDRIKDDGTITLMHSKEFKAAGKKRGELEKEIRAAYVPSLYQNLTVTIKPQLQFYFVGGEVRSPNRYEYVGKMTVIKAIQSAGDFTDYANKKKVQVIRANGRVETINCLKAIRDPRLDLPVYPGDTIRVPNRVL